MLALLIGGLAAGPTVRGWYRQSDNAAHTAALEASRAQQGEATVSDPDDPASWTDYRGPRGLGSSDEQQLVDGFGSAGPTELYRQPIGGGHAGFVVAKGRAVTIEQRRGDEVVSAYDLATGAELWTHAYAALFSESMGGDGPRATPTIEGDTVLALGATGFLHALSLDAGEVRWRHQVLDELGLANLQWGLAAAPLVVDGLVVVATSGIEGPGLVAYDLGTGEERWTSEWLLQGYSSPVVVELGGVRQILHLSGLALVGVDIHSGDILWRFGWDTFKGISAAQPLQIDGQRVFVSTGYDKGSVMVDIRPAGETWGAQALWKTKALRSAFNSPVVVDDTIFGLDEGVLVALSVADGSELWRGPRYGRGQLMYADGKLIVLSEDGEVVLVEATGEAHREVARARALTGRTWNVPALAGGRLLVRNEREMVAWDLRAR